MTQKPSQQATAIGSEQEGATGPIGRRRLIRLGWIAAGVVFIGGQIGLLLKLFFTPSRPGTFGSTVALGPVERFAVGSVTHFWKERFLLVRQPSGFLALAQECTHQQICNVDFIPERHIIACPCHGAEYSLTGAVLAGPAPRPLDRYATTIRDGQVLVDTSHRLRSRASAG